MKKISLIFIVLITTNLIAQTLVNSTIQTVKVYKQQAEITAIANTKLLAGKQEIVLTNISTQINPASLQVQLANGTNVTLLSAKYENNYVLPAINRPEITNLKNQLENLTKDLAWINDQKEILKGMEDVMNQNKNLTNAENGFTASQVTELANNYKIKLLEIRKEHAALKEQERDKTEEKNKIQNQLNELSAKFNKPSGNLVLQFYALAPTTIDLKCKYIVNGAGWSPLYDLRAENINTNVRLDFKANVYQNTGQDWNDVNVVVSTGNPSANNNRPVLNPLYVNYYVAYIDNKLQDGVSQKAMMNMAYAGAQPEKDEELFEQAFSYDAQSTENQLNVEYKITHKQTLLSDGKYSILPLESQELKTKYIYHAVPKLDQSAFLLAKISDWTKLNLIDGEANIFFEGAYVGKSYINSDITSDTLLLSMGRDENISIQRKQLVDFTETKWLGANKKETFAYEITIKNKKNSAITLEVLDQIPVSNNKEIEVELIEKSGAIYDETIGKLFWTLDIPAGQSKTVKLVYTVKYPKDKTVTGKK